ncbi:hypothetical protein [Melittangium boletus]|uniref:Roadblock/LAMTOR2 domain-containing protein n=1 Tax=Melittangium boletus DSM 14713 TaxID=1294270 RepID=A0A250IG06_9BACT|nr:hypothetical protein [Melittangium boletus]ATB30097.1 hypothetical protein MEBOL_003552 [Melittangium boletus DSM 14713]
MEAVRNICRDLVEGLEGGLACAVIDLRTTQLIGVYNKVTGKSTLHEAVVAGFAEMFRGPSVTRVEQLVRMQRGIPENGDYAFQEIQIVSRNNLHFASVLSQGRAALMLITSRSTRLEEGWRGVREHIPRIEAVLSTAH